MNQNNDTNIKCPNSEHANNVKIVCFNESCKADRLQCIECIQNGIHITHLQHQQDLLFLFEHISDIEKQCEDLIIDLNKQMDMAYEQFYLLIGGIRSKYQKSKQQFLNLDSKQMNYFFAESIKFKSFEQTNFILIQQSIKDFQDSIVKLLSDLKLSELNYNQISNQDIDKSEELYKKGYKLYWDDDNYKEAIKIFDQSLIFNPKNCNSLYCKADSLRMLGQYNEAIVWADKALKVDSKDCDSLYCKAASLKMLGQYNEAIIWADEALKVDPKHCSSLFTKSDSLRLLKMFKQSMEVIEQSLKINPNHFDSLWAKGKCLQDQNQYQEALIYYKKALMINPNHEWTRDRKDECLKAINQK
ncbi:unnamed protein product [Paramecium pentaurelia]|uniref:Tetratricopeptide repeat protein n=1 Tax=Paramecium pentaurelia TaxID=43138 RepID=A0A8S1VLQ4_9CILI|nr:unnamed protein product [Paramecium pentaurelia]